MRFDWYQATIPEHPNDLIEMLMEKLAPGGEVVRGRGRYNYHQSLTVRSQRGESVAVVLAGGPNGNPNATASGAATDNFVSLVRECWPNHRVTRFDAAEDLCQRGVWEVSEAICRGVGKQLGIKGRSIVPDDPTEGRTYYLGAASSDVRVRLYDKTAEVRRRLPPERHAEVPSNWVRLEAQIRPRKEWKDYAARVSPTEAWGFSSWTAELAKRVLALRVDRIKMQAGRETDDERAYRFLIRQYGPMLRRLCKELGSWEEVGRKIGRDL